MQNRGLISGCEHCSFAIVYDILVLLGVDLLDSLLTFKTKISDVIFRLSTRVKACCQASGCPILVAIVAGCQIETLGQAKDRSGLFCHGLSFVQTELPLAEVEAGQVDVGKRSILEFGLA